MFKLNRFLNYFSSIIQQKGNTTQTVFSCFFFLLLLARRSVSVCHPKFSTHAETMERHTGFPLIDI